MHLSGPEQKNIAALNDRAGVIPVVDGTAGFDDHKFKKVIVAVGVADVVVRIVCRRVQTEWKVRLQQMFRHECLACFFLFSHKSTSLSLSFIIPKQTDSGNFFIIIVKSG